MQNICIFEDEGYKKLLPLTYMRPAYGLRCGMTILLEKILRQYQGVAFDLHCRDYLFETVKKAHLTSLINTVGAVSQCLFLNGRILASSSLSKKIPLIGEDEIFVSGHAIVAARLSDKNLEKIKNSLEAPLSRKTFDSLKIKTTGTDVALIDFPWELVIENEKEIVEDFKALAKGGKVLGDVHPMVAIYEDQDVFIDSGSEIMACSVLDASEGPIYIGKDVIIYPHTRVEGPAYIGDKTEILGGKIRKGTSIGPRCKVAGEVEGSIIHGYSNKQHDGFLGHSYICEWVNLGAGTTTSDLKNNYGHVKVEIGNEMIDTGQILVGSFIADHSKTAIGTLLNSGTVIGVACNIFGCGFPPKYIPSFSWGESEHDLEKALHAARTVMSRRGIDMSSADELLLRKIFELTKEDR
ncbi:MAG: putative sugar nucleotidyl transferase [Candidatus Saganbacteria bacterium]|nr:putative sugar nucleotidyl transferase [Candidatus Saganbacteria bacterium]